MSPWLAWWVPAFAATPTCAPWPPGQLARWDADAREALQDEDLDRFRVGWEELQAVAPCVQGVVDAGTWARYLVALAIYEYATGGAWAEALDTALATWPEVPRDLGPPDVRDREPPTPTIGTEPLPAGAEWYLDGRPVASLPSLAGVHLLQRRAGGVVETRLLRNGTFPDEWRQVDVAPPPPPVAAVPDPEAWGLAAIGGGVGGRSQALDARNPHVPEGGAIGAVLGVVSRGAGPVGPVLLGWALDGSLQLGAGPALDGYGTAGVRLGPAVLGLGGGLTTGVVTVDDAARVVFLPQPHASLRLSGGPATVEVAGGWTLAAWHAGATAAAQLGDRAGPAIVASVLTHHSTFDEEGGDLSLQDLRWTATLGVGGAFGTP
jgi:hypothetical protein